ncbi:hypothetical protein F4703DRAFT_1890754, partial [Phycomyces blakesleeanus]
MCKYNEDIICVFNSPHLSCLSFKQAFLYSFLSFISLHFFFRYRLLLLSYYFIFHSFIHSLQFMPFTMSIRISQIQL